MARYEAATSGAMKIPVLRFVARASRRAASTVVSTFFSAVTRNQSVTPIFDGAVSRD